MRLASVIVKYKADEIRNAPIEAVNMIIDSKGVGGRKDLTIHRVTPEDVDVFCELIGKDNPAFDEIIDAPVPASYRVKGSGGDWSLGYFD